MGFPMAVNLRSKVDKSTKILICDVSPDQIEKYKSTVQGKGEVGTIANGAEAARQAVSSAKDGLVASELTMVFRMLSSQCFLHRTV